MAENVAPLESFFREQRQKQFGVGDNLFNISPISANTTATDNSPTFGPIYNASPLDTIGKKNAPISTYEIPKTNQQMAGNLGALSGGIQSGSKFSQPTGETDFFSAGNMAQIGLAGASGGAAGFMVGGPVGAVVGAVAGMATAGLGAFLNARAEARRQKESKALQERADKLQKKYLAEQEKWNRINRSDALRQEKYNKDTVKLQNLWSTYQNVQKQMMNTLSNNSSLKERFIQQGF